MNAADARTALLTAELAEKFVLDASIRERRRGGPYLPECLLAREALHARSTEARELYRSIVAIEVNPNTNGVLK